MGETPHGGSRPTPSGFPAYNGRAMERFSCRPSGKPASKKARRRNNSPLRILVVDVNDAIPHLTTDVLIRFGCHRDAVESNVVVWVCPQVIGYDSVVTNDKMANASVVQLTNPSRVSLSATSILMAKGRSAAVESIPRPWAQPGVFFVCFKESPPSRDVRAFRPGAVTTTVN